MPELANKNDTKQRKGNYRAIAIHQPNYFPWLGYFFKIFQSDLFVFLDDVQYTNEGMQDYQYIKTPQGSFRLRIPINKKFGQKIKEVTIKDELNWRKKHLRTIEMNYKKAPYFDTVFPDFYTLIINSSPYLSDLDRLIIEFICKKFGIHTAFINSSELSIDSQREEKILDICSALDANIYLSGIGAKAYQNPRNFQKRGIKLKYSTFKQFEYPQLWGSFQNNVSIIDYLMNCGYNWNRVLDNQKSN